MGARIVAAAIAALLLAACTTPSPPPAPTPAAASPSPAAPSPSVPPATWQQVALPAGLRPSALAAAGEDLLVGGRTDAPAPMLVRLHDGSPAARFRLAPADPNAEAADLVRLTVAGDDVHAIGSMIAGAHSNPRLTVWDGSLSSSRLASRPQEFFTFGGHDAGPLLGTVVVDGRPVIAGSRVGGRGPYGLLWTRRGHTWTAQEPPSGLASTPDREFGFSAVAASGDRVVITGDELGLAGGLTQLPVAFVGGVAGPWQHLPLPVPADPPPVPGQLTRATSVACTAAGTTCWVAGWARGHALAWPLTVPAAGEATAATPAVLPGDPPGGNDPTALVTLAGGRPVVTTNANVPTTAVQCATGWLALPGPQGRTTALAAAGGSAYAVSDGVLWRLDLPSC